MMNRKEHEELQKIKFFGYNLMINRPKLHAKLVGIYCDGIARKPKRKFRYRFNPKKKWRECIERVEVV